MATAVRMPKLGMSMQDGSVVEWPLTVGTRVEKGQTVVVIEHDKAEAEVEAIASGFLRHIYLPVNPEHRVPCGTLLAAITETMEESFDADAFRAEETPPEAPEVAAPTSTPIRVERPMPQAQRPSDGSGSPVAPAARALAKKLGIDLVRITGTGPGGRIRKEDVEAWAERSKGLIEIGEGVALEVRVRVHTADLRDLPAMAHSRGPFARSRIVDGDRRRCLHDRDDGLGRRNDRERTGASGGCEHGCGCRARDSP
jgi:pyruvate/2-oxoglutarate dehydrogenase complex dihydrolipoamide acyltransferase (E2) component